jgi:hypothetical protein
MSRAGYYDDDDPLAMGRWRAAVRSAMRGKRGQAFFKEALAALDAMPDKRLIAGYLVVDGDQIPYGDKPDIIVGADELVDRQGVPMPMGAVCLLGAVGQARGLDMTDLDPEDIETVAPTFGLADAMTREIVYWNDEGGDRGETPEQRWKRMRAWIAKQITAEKA